MKRFVLPVLLLLASCTLFPSGSDPLPPGAEARSLRGEVLYPPPVPEGQREALEQQLLEAHARWQAAPDDADALIWYGRRLGYLGRFNEAIVVFTEGIQRHPDDARMWRFRGHRWITLRQFDKAVADLEKAALLIRGRADEVEPSGQPNARGIDLDTLHENVWYHLALARFLLGDWEGAVDGFRACRETVRNDDGRAMCAYWIASAARRAAVEAAARGDTQAARSFDAEVQLALADVRQDMDIVEYLSYHRLALAWRGEVEPSAVLEGARAAGSGGVDFATVGYGVAHWLLCRGQREAAREVLEEVCQGESWHAFGHIAAEVELARMEAAR
jgi:tetratricopeptide (TPR) repeat protein